MQGETMHFGDDGRVTVAVGEDGVGHVRLARPDKMNALDPGLFAGIIAAGEHLRERPGLRAVVLAGEGRAFCAGLDTASFAALGAGDSAPLTARTHGNANAYQEVAMTWRKCPVPVIAAVHGVCFGGGLQIAGGADIRVVHPATRLAVMEMKWGIVPDMAGFTLWRGLVRGDALRELTYTNREFSGEEAARLGFATVLDDEPLARASAIAAQIAGKNPDAIRAAKRLFAAMDEEGEDAILAAESAEQAALIRTPNQIEAVMAEMERRTPVFR